MKTSSLAVLATLAAALVVPAAPAHAAAPTCQGHRATLVGPGADRVLTGTPHRDVIVSAGAVRIDAGAGDDLVCVTGGRNQVSVDAGAGDDVVVNRSRSKSVSYTSGTGSDRYSGGRFFDSVRLRPDGYDVVGTGGGSDMVDVTPVRGPRRAEIDLGGGNDNIWLHLSSLEGTIDGGSGTDTLIPAHGSQQAWTFDNGRGRALAGREQRFRWRSLESFDLSFLRAPSIDFHGSDRADTFYAQDIQRTSRLLTLRMRGGDDSVTVFARSHGSVDGGAGRDELHASLNYVGPETRLVLDLAAGSAETTDTVGSRSWRVTGVEDAAADGFQTAELRGTDGANRLTARATCRATLEGRGGDDVLDASFTGCSTLGGPAVAATLLGGPGNDDMVGSPGDDTLDGGDGTDSADGQAGTDTCVAETKMSCEL